MAVDGTGSGPRRIPGADRMRRRRRRATLPAMAPESPQREPAPFSEKGFYLAEFRGRTLALVAPTLEAAELAAVERVLAQLDGNGSRLLVVSADRGLLDKLVGTAVVEAAAEDWVGALWSRLRRAPRAGLALDAGAELPAVAAEVALRLRPARLVVLDERGGVDDASGRRLSFVDLPTLERLLAAGGQPHSGLLGEIRRALARGFPAITVCSAAGLDEELFTWSGSGTLFTRERYASVRALAFDEFDAAHELIARGVEEGYLLPRSEAELGVVLANAFGVFVEGRFLAGIGALLPWARERAGEIASLYTLTRFVGEGVGDHLVRFALERARAAQLDYVFACTASTRVERFFERHGFRSVADDAVPSARWQGYDPARRRHIRCLRRDLS